MKPSDRTDAGLNLEHLFKEIIDLRSLTLTFQPLILHSLHVPSHMQSIFKKQHAA